MITAALHIWWLPAAAWAAWRTDVEWHPFRRCQQCKGSGRNRGSRQDAFGLCRHGLREPRLFAKHAAARHLRRKGLS